MKRHEDMTEEDFRRPLTQVQWLAVKKLFDNMKSGNLEVGPFDDGIAVERAAS